jgi:hypothetical protein
MMGPLPAKIQQVQGSMCDELVSLSSPARAARSLELVTRTTTSRASCGGALPWEPSLTTARYAA